MRTKTMLVSALLGTLGSVSLMAQTNVYSLNVVGYVNITCYPGNNLISCPLNTSPDNTVNTLLNNAGQAYTGDWLFFYTPSGGYSIDQAQVIGRGGTANTNGWLNNGTNVLAPGVGCWFQNNNGTNITLTFVGQVPTGTYTNVLYGNALNLVSSWLPFSGDLITNGLSGLTNYNEGDWVYTYNALVAETNASVAYSIYQSGTGRGQGGYGYTQATGQLTGGPGDWNALGDPVEPYVGGAFWYLNQSAPNVNWVETYQP